MSIFLYRTVLSPEGVFCTLIEEGSGSVKCFVHELCFSSSLMLFLKKWVIEDSFLAGQAYLII